MLGKIIGSVVPAVVNTKLKVRHYSPELFLGAGIAAGVAAVVMAAKAHKKAAVYNDVVMEEDLNDIDEQVRDGDFDEETAKAERIVVYRDAAIEYTKLYGPAVLMGASSIVLILASHGFMKKRERALVSALGIVQTSFYQYRQRVAEAHGQQEEERLYYNAEQEKFTVVTKDGDKTKKTKTKRNRLGSEMSPTMYDRIFDETSRNWYTEPTMNTFFLSSVQQHMNDQLRLNGWVSLNDVYKALGLAPSDAGQIVGWAEEAYGDDYISFGLDDEVNQEPHDGRYHLSFNVNGNILEHIRGVY